MTDSNAGPQEPVQTPRAPEAYNRLTGEITAVPTHKLRVISFDIATAVTILLGVWKQLLGLRARIVEEMPRFNIARFDKLEDYALALWHAHILYRAASEPVGSLQGLYEEGVDLRELLASDASALAKRGLLDATRLKELKGAVGYRPIASDLSLLPAVLRENGTAIAGKTAVTPAELDRAEVISEQILMALGERDQGPAVSAEATLNRQRAYTLFVEAYEDASGAVRFLRREEKDADDFVPTLYVRTSSGKRDEGSTPPVPVPPVMTTPPVEPPSNGQPKTQIAPGLPGASPYVNE